MSIITYLKEELSFNCYHTNINEHYLKEIGDRSIEPKNVKLSVVDSTDDDEGLHFSYTFPIEINGKNELYFTDISVIENEIVKLPKVELFVDFGIKKNYKYSYDITNYNQPLIVISQVIAIIHRFLKTDLLKEIRKNDNLVEIEYDLFLSAITFDSKEEYVDDNRRTNLYKKIITNQLKKLNINIVSIGVGDYSDVSIKVEPIKIKDIK